MYISALVLCFTLAIGCSVIAIAICVKMNTNSDDGPTEVSKVLS